LTTEQLSGPVGSSLVSRVGAVAGRGAVMPRIWAGSARSLLPARGGLSWTPDIYRDGMLLIGLIVGVAIATTSVFNPVDAANYWNAGTSTRLYPGAWSEYAPGYLFYPPFVAQLSTLLQPIGWQAFVVLLTVGTFGAMWYCARRWSFALLLLGVPHYLNVGPPELATFLDYALLDNLQWILAALCIVAIRRPSLWALFLFTKVTSAVGWWWHPLRGEWRKAATGAAAALVVFAVSFIAAPHMWFDFAGFVAANYTMANPPMTAFFVPVGIRIPTAFLLVAWGARTDRPWTVPVAIGWALPALYGLGFLPFWVAAAVAWRDGRLAPAVADTPLRSQALSGADAILGG
jgi:hypothetical protein